MNGWTDRIIDGMNERIERLNGWMDGLKVSMDELMDG